MKKGRITKSTIAIILSGLKQFDDPKPNLEQYSTPSELAADLIWTMYMREELQQKNVADFGCGTGILGIGALISEAKKVFFVDLDKKAIDSAKQNLKKIRSEFEIKGEAIFINKDINKISKNDIGTPDSIIQNPPFGIKRRHADKIFLEKTMELTKNIYSFHMSSSEHFISKLCEEKGFKVKEIIHYNYILPSTMKFHKKKITTIKAGLWNIKKKKK